MDIILTLNIATRYKTEEVHSRFLNFVDLVIVKAKREGISLPLASISHQGKNITIRIDNYKNDMLTFNFYLFLVIIFAERYGESFTEGNIVSHPVFINEQQYYPVEKEVLTIDMIERNYINRDPFYIEGRHYPIIQRILIGIENQQMATHSEILKKIILENQIKI